MESPAKARTVGKFLGKDYVIEASVGHIRDLPANAAEIPAAFKKEKWARLGIDIENAFKPLYVVPKEKRDQIRKLKQLVKDASVVYLATDEDREGESISWHLVQELAPKGETKRLVFHEITKSAIEESLRNPRSINEHLVEAQETRRLVDRLYGYLVSPLLWKKIRPRLSAGRVQSVATRLVVERERERMRFHTAEYWDLDGTFQGEGSEPFNAGLVALGGQRVATGRDFDPDTGQLKKSDGEAPIQLTEQQAKELTERLTGQTAEVKSLEQKPFTERPSPPFTTSTLQQEAARRLRYTAQRTMRAAQRLYENGYITYMRTDSTTLSDEALTASRALIKETYGADYLPAAPRVYKTKVKNAQEAHEAIRPAGATMRTPESLAAELGADERKLYELIYRRTVACQMLDARGQRTTLQLEIDDARFQATGRTFEFQGFRLAYAQPTEEGDASGDRILPNVQPGDGLEVASLEAQGHQTQPPARLTEASLIREMEARGIGRPSTYASIIETILARDYVFKKGSALVPTFTAFAVVNLLDRFLNHLIDYAFTARMEDDLDEISNGRQDRLEYLRSFYSGNGRPGLKDTLDRVEKDIDPREVCGIPLGNNESGELVEVRVGRYGPFLSCGESRVSVPDQTAPDELTLEKAIELLIKGGDGPRSLGKDPKTDLEVFVKIGRFGPYFQLGDPDQLDGEKPKMASLLAGMEPDTVTLEEGLACLSMPRSVGTKKTEEGEDVDILAANGRFGPYIKWGKETRSIPEGESPLTITLERAVYLLSQPKARGRQSRQPKVLVELGEHPETKEAVRILDGRYGPYVTDGTTNASLPRGESAKDLTMERAVDLLAERAARAPAKKKKTAKKATAKKKTPSKKAGAKKAGAKKAGSTKKGAPGDEQTAKS
ncbi:MAG: type I DNA topoisomerase [Planctomycetota bacterium]